MLKGILSLAAAVAVGAAVFANSASAEDLTKFYSTERVRGYKSGEFMILAENDVNFRANPALSNNIISCLPRHSLLRITKEEQPWAEAVWNGQKGYIAAEYLTPAEAEPLLSDEDINFGEWKLDDVFAPENAGLGKLLKEGKEHGDYVYEYNDVKISVNRKKHTITALEGTSSLFATMRGISVGDETARVVGQYGMPSRIVYFTPEKNEMLKQTMMIGYDFQDDGGYDDAGLDFYIDAHDRVSKIVLHKDK